MNSKKISQQIEKEYIAEKLFNMGFFTKITNEGVLVSLYCRNLNTIEVEIALSNYFKLNMSKVGNAVLVVVK